jgi:bifunctional UDP-N-acetylglucosamine pyrophosphorylase/glucosamine-1-phosphate N-acetyltransferase
MQARASLAGFAGTLLVLAGDTPLLTAGTLGALVAAHRARRAAATILSARLPDPAGYGRIVRGAGGAVERIVEHTDASARERSIDEINTGSYCFESSDLFGAVDGLRAENAKREFYLTDTIGLLIGAARRVEAILAEDWREALGVNTPEQRAEAEAILRERMRAAGREGAA